MNIVPLLLALLQEFFGTNPTVEEIEAIALPLITAISAAKKGQAFSTPNIPLSIDAVKGNATISWTPAS